MEKTSWDPVRSSKGGREKVICAMGSYKAGITVGCGLNSTAFRREGRVAERTRDKGCW